MKLDYNQSFKPGEVVYIIIRNPHAQDVANIQQAAVVQNPDAPNQLALFVHETYYPLSDEFAVFSSEEEAEQAYQEAFGLPEEFYG
ncbi:transcriptional regulator SplA domain-containing protein [Heyndrickxia camelliae]|uniref:Transcriptional regulator n=1 Tax=Heyndrickxia camelliae TaxID=1707093 RepID=A0A2N3LIQ2_9BACI|nr:transcriptional regulator SplA domain-containing protein [Heyndrickxia camelliae]PKR84454.1 transcriptional regulator [Heyndrickxia camelliae]